MEHSQIAERLRQALDQEVARHEISPDAWSRIEPRLRPRVWRPALALAAAVVVVAATAAATLPLWHAPSRPAAAPAPPRLVITGRDRLPGRAIALAAGFGSMWLVGSGVIYRVDQATARTVALIAAPGTGVPSGIAAGAGAVWVTSDHGGHVGVYRIDPRRDRVTDFIPLPSDPVSIAVGGGRVWVGENSAPAPCVVMRIDPVTNRTTGSPITVGDAPVSIVSGAGSLWVTSGAGDSVVGIDPATGAVTATLSIPTVDAVGAGSLWGATGYAIQRMDPSALRPPVTITLPGAQDVVFWAGSAWAVTGAPSVKLVRIDPATNRVTGVAAWFGNDLIFVVATPGSLWVNDYRTGELLRMSLS